jgi:rod shape determining protein RodA
MIKITKIKNLPWLMVLLIIFIALLGIMMLYSAANGNMHPWALKQAIRLGVGLVVMIIVSMVEMRHWILSAYSFYIITLIMLVLVELLGFVGMGAQRWIDLYFFNFQPSELMRIALLLALSRYFYDLDFKQLKDGRLLILPLCMVIVPVLLVCRQPDLGTAMLLIFGACSIFFISGVHWGYFLGAGGVVLTMIPIFWNFLHEYQKNRILNFLTPERDPANTGYHVIQSKIALGSSGFWGKGFLQGSQSHLNFLPEKQTDFIFTMFSEEFGFAGSFFLIFLYSIWLFCAWDISISCKNRFGKILSTGLTTSFFVYVFVNIAMVTGLLPVVGIPLPFFSYGGTSLLTLLFSQGILFSIYFHNRKNSHYI